MRFILLLTLLITPYIYAASNYFLCGPDEDGCSSAYYDSCLCIPYDTNTANQPYCLDFNEISCVPLSKKPDCARGNIFKNQATCLATAFQSEPTPPCPLTTKSFCIQHHIPTCQKDKGMNSCHALP